MDGTSVSETKSCRKCGIEKELESFKAASTCRGGRRNICKACAKKYESARHHAPVGWKPMTLEHRLWSRIDKRGPNDCWPWLGKSRYGYGYIVGVVEGSTNSRSLSAHRVAFQLRVGTIPVGADVSHACGNKICCNPKHLYLATHKERSKRLPESVLNEKFWARVDKSNGPAACWTWTGPCGPSGYGVTSRRGDGTTRGHRVVGSHRRAWELANGRATQPGEMVLHSCDNPPCCNPAHLRIGTNADNMLDMWSRDRHPRQLGEKHPLAKMSAKDIPIIRARHKTGESCADIAADYGVTHGTVYMVVNGRTWRHIA